MRLTRLRLLRTPGLREPFTLEPAQGINLVTGPNGIGKSSVCRAVRSLLWPDSVNAEPFEAEAEFEIGSERLRVTRRNLDQPGWSGGPRPDLGPDHLAERYQLGVLDLLRPDRLSDPLAREIRKHMAGGFDLGAVREALFPSRTGRSEKNVLKTSRGQVTRLKKEQDSLAYDQDRLEDLTRERRLAGAARDRLAALETVQEIIQLTLAREDAVSRLENLPPACEMIRPEDPGKLEDLRRQERTLRQEINKRTADLTALDKELGDLQSTGSRSADLPVGLLKRKLETLVDLGRDVRQAERDASDFNLAEVLADASLKPSIVPAILMLAAGAALAAAGLLLALPSPLLNWIAVSLGGAAGGYGCRELVYHFRGLARSRLILAKREEAARKKDHLASCRGQLAGAQAEFNAELAGSEIAPVADAQEAAQLLEDLATRRNRVSTLEAERKTAGVFLERERADQDRVSGEIHDILNRLGLDDEAPSDAEAARLLKLFPRFEKAVQSRDDAAREIDRLTIRLDDGGNLLREGESPGMSPGSLAGLIDIEKQRAAELETLQKEIARIEVEIDHAHRGHDLQEALAAASSSLAALSDVRQSNRESALGLLMLDRAERQHAKESRPLVLARADEYFSLFTGGRYGLEMARQGDGEDRFQAVVEDSVQPLELSELSDGTRTQLLLAVKLAFVTVGEEGGRPPIFLDDSLTSADPDRFAAVAVSLGKLAADEDRQIFYLTPNPTDGAALGRALSNAGLAAAHHIDLAQVRGVAGAADLSLIDPANLPPDLMAPDPAGLSPVEYGTALQVPRPDPWAPWGALPVFYVLNDHLDLVRRLVDGNAPTLARFARGRDILITATTLDADEAAFVDAGGKLWKAWLDGWRLGRSRPVPPSFLQESAAVSEKFLEPITTALENCHWDGAGLLEAIENKEVKKFRANKLEQLRQELEVADLLAHGTPLTEDQLLTHTRNRVAPLLAANILDMQKVRTLALTFARLVENK